MSFAKSKWASPLILQVIAVLLLAGCAGGGGGGSVDVWQGARGNPQMQQQAMAKTDHLIVPGGRIGPIRLGMSMDEVTDTLGASPLYLNRHGGPGLIGTTLKYPALNLTIDFDKSPTPTAFNIQYSVSARSNAATAWSDFEPASVDFHTARGLTVGSTSFDASRMYGQYHYTSSDDMNFEQLKMELLLTDDHRVWSIEIGK